MSKPDTIERVERPDLLDPWSRPFFGLPDRLARLLEEPEINIPVSQD